jgi:DNA-binding GntR family transcriptional regulator
MTAGRCCRRDRIRDAIVSRILAGHYPPGTRLTELALAAEFGVSQAPVREALRELATLGLVVTKPFCGTRVQSADAADLREAYELRAVIEERSAQLAVPCAPETLAALAAEVDRMSEAAGRRDSEGYAQAALTFHRRIVSLSGNRLFLCSWENQLWDVRSRIASHRAVDDLTAYAAAHDAVVQALGRGDGHQAGQLLRQMMERLLNDLEKLT